MAAPTFTPVPGASFGDDPNSPYWSQVLGPLLMETLAQQPVSGVNVHAQPQGKQPFQPWIQDQAIEPVPFGSLADPVSQLAFMLAPGLLRGGKAALEAAGTPGPRLGPMLASERGNLGPVPRGPQGEPLPESLMRDESGELERYFHGTPHNFPDFDLAHAGTSHGERFGPGVYMAKPPEVGQWYATKYWGEHGQDALLRVKRLHESKAFYLQQAAEAPTPERAVAYTKMASETDPLIAQAEGAMRQYTERWPHLFEQPANIRPVYPNLKRPFDLRQRVPEEVASDILSAMPATQKNVAETLRNYTGGQGATKFFNMTGQQLYNLMESAHRGDLVAANQLLQRFGYDGIIATESGAMGAPHTIVNAFSPDQVYPSFGVDALKQEVAKLLQRPHFGGQP